MPDTLKQGAAADPSTEVGGGTTELYMAAGDFFRMLEEWEGEDLLREAVEQCKEDRPGHLAQLIGLALPPFEAADLSHEDKRLALDLATEFGRDRAQWFYHLAVLVTKLA